MISVEIEKEINQENKVILNFNVRQVVCLGITLAFILFIIFVLGIDYEISVYPAGIVAVIMAAFGWYKPNGLPFEKVLLKKAQQFFYHSNVRKYRTKKPIRDDAQC
jgi:energy-coupling factor transporter transmembrane protein EcfT